MAVTSIMTTEGEINAKAGAGASSDYTEAMKNATVLQAESIVNCYSRYNFSGAGVFTALSSGVKYLLSTIVATYVAIDWVKYDMGKGYTSRTEAENILNFLRDDFNRNLSRLTDKEIQRFIKSAT